MIQWIVPCDTMDQVKRPCDTMERTMFQAHVSPPSPQRSRGERLHVARCSVKKPEPPHLLPLKPIRSVVRPRAGVLLKAWWGPWRSGGGPGLAPGLHRSPLRRTERDVYRRGIPPSTCFFLKPGRKVLGPFPDSGLYALVVLGLACVHRKSLWMTASAE